MGVVPEFELLEAGIISDSEDAIGLSEKPKRDEKSKLWRRYVLRMEGFETDIIDVFPDREMFTRPEEWLAEPQYLNIPDDETDILESGPSLSPTETLVQCEELFESRMPPYAEVSKEALTDSSNGLLRFMAVFIAVLLLLNVHRDGEQTTSQFGSALFSRIARLLDVQGVGDDS